MHHTTCLTSPIDSTHYYLSESYSIVPVCVVVVEIVFCSVPNGTSLAVVSALVHHGHVARSSYGTWHLSAPERNHAPLTSFRAQIKPNDLIRTKRAPRVTLRAQTERRLAFIRSGTEISTISSRHPSLRAQRHTIRPKQAHVTASIDPKHNKATQKETK